MATDTHRFIYKHTYKKEHIEIERCKKVTNTTCIKTQTLSEEVVGKKSGVSSIFTHKRMSRATGRRGKKRKEEQVRLSSHTATYGNKNRHMKPHIKRNMQREKGC